MYGALSGQSSGKSGTGQLMPQVLDTTVNCTGETACLRQQSYDTVIRYYSRSDWKLLKQPEAAALAAAGLRIAAVYQNRQNQPLDFSHRKARPPAATRMTTRRTPSSSPPYRRSTSASTSTRPRPRCWRT
jgi:hypothetical protein